MLTEKELYLLLGVLEEYFDWYEEGEKEEMKDRFNSLEKIYKKIKKTIDKQ